MRTFPRNTRRRSRGLALVGGITTGLVLAFQALCILVSLGFSAGVIYVAWHFISKFW